MRTLTGTLRLLRLAIRRDRVVLTIWVVALAGLVVASVASVSGLYTTEAEREAVAAFTAANRLARAFDGPAMGTSIGAITMTETFGVLAVLAALMSIQTVTRHTRQDEETGRAELVGSAVVGHNARLAAALLLVTTANAILALTTTLVLLAQGLPAPGSIAVGIALGAVGMTFATIAALTAQIAETQRAANGLAGIVLGVSYLLRAVGDAAGEVAPSGVELISAWPSWLSPIGWGQQLRPFGDERWAVLGLFAVVVLVGLVAAFAISARRDLDGALLATRPGPASANGSLRSPIRVAWRTQRSIVLAWAIGIAVFATAFGTLGDGAEDLVGLSDELAAAFEQLAADGSLVDAFIAFTMGMVGIAAAGFAVQSGLRARNEESTGRLEPLLATAVSRWRWLGANAAITTAGSVVILAIAGVAGGLGYGAATGEFATGLTSFLAAGAVQLPAVLVLAAAVFAVFGVAPGLAPGLGWGLLAVSFTFGQLGELLGLPDMVMELSPFTHVPAVPAVGWEVVPLAVLTGLALLLGLVGVLSLRRRDLAI